MFYNSEELHRFEYSASADDYFVYTVRKPTWLGRWFGYKVLSIAYRGSCSTWHEYPSAKTVSSVVALWLHEIWLRHKWQERQTAKPLSGSSSRPSL